ncbi:MAG: hypothetical protein QOF21_443 [Actinomycetota bacterium]|jgi:hypothetical protein
MPRLKPAQITEELSDVWRLIVGYTKQETTAPLRGIARFARFGFVGMVSFAIASGFAAIAIVRALQTETGDSLDGNFSFVPYLGSIVGCAIVFAFAIRSVAKTPWKNKSSDKQGGSS